MALAPLRLAAAAGVVAVATALYWIKKKSPESGGGGGDDDDGRESYSRRIGSTPMVELRSLSKLTGCRVLAKVEYANPGGTGKDRIALAMIEEAERDGRLRPGGTVVEGTSGSTGISLSALSAARGYRCVIVMPDDQAPEKRRLIEGFGGEVHVVKTAAIANPEHYVNVARRLAEGTPGAVFMNQFETLANYRAHLTATGPEIWRGAAQLCGGGSGGSKGVLGWFFGRRRRRRRRRGGAAAKPGGDDDDDDDDFDDAVHAFVMAAGTGGTIAGVSQYLKARSGGRAAVILADPPGSSLYRYVRSGVCWNAGQAERSLRRHRYDTIAEGIGLDRVTANLALAEIDDAVAVTDQQAVDAAHYLLRHEGLFVGSSSAVNVAATVRFCAAARRRSSSSSAKFNPAPLLPPGAVVVTVLCDSGHRHTSRFWCREKLASDFNLKWPSDKDPDPPAWMLAEGPL
jgi:cysteine synthase A